MSIGNLYPEKRLRKFAGTLTVDEGRGPAPYCVTVLAFTKLQAAAALAAMVGRSGVVSARYDGEFPQPRRRAA